MSEEMCSEVQVTQAADGRMRVSIIVPKGLSGKMREVMERTRLEAWLEKKKWQAIKEYRILYPERGMDSPTMGR